jgi:methionine-rich copper-binding protein CopC
VKKLTAFLVGALLLGVLGSVVHVPVALAHAEIESCTPAIGGTVETAPEKLICEASQGMKAEGSALEVLDASGARVDRGDSAVDLTNPDRTTISVSLDPAKMKDGVYTVKWTTVSADDDDEASGEFTFTVGHVMDTDQTATPAASETHDEDHAVATTTVDGKQVTLQMISPANDAVLPPGDVLMEARVEGLTLGDNAHLHFYVDDALALMGTGTQTSFTAKLEPGEHDLEIGLATGEHDDLLKVHVHVMVEASAQATAATTQAAATTVPTTVPATPTAAPTEAPVPTATAAPEATPAPLPGTGGADASPLFGMLFIIGALLLGAGVYVGARARR